MIESKLDTDNLRCKKKLNLKIVWALVAILWQLLVVSGAAISVDPSIRRGHTFLLSKLLCSMRGYLCSKQKFRIPLQQEDEQDPYWFVVKLGLLLEL